MERIDKTRAILIFLISNTHCLWIYIGVNSDMGLRVSTLYFIQRRLNALVLLDVGNE